MLWTVKQDKNNILYEFVLLGNMDLFNFIKKNYYWFFKKLLKGIIILNFFNIEFFFGHMQPLKGKWIMIHHQNLFSIKIKFSPIVLLALFKKADMFIAAAGMTKKIKIKVTIKIFSCKKITSIDFCVASLSWTEDNKDWMYWHVFSKKHCDMLKNIKYLKIWEQSQSDRLFIHFFDLTMSATI